MTKSETKVLRYVFGWDDGERTYFPAVIAGAPGFIVKTGSREAKAATSLLRQTGLVTIEDYPSFNSNLWLVRPTVYNA